MKRICHAFVFYRSLFEMALTNILQTVREDDYVEYYLFPPLNSTENEETQLNTYLTKINNIVNKYNNGYLWHKDKFNLISRPTSSKFLYTDEFKLEDRVPCHIYGILHYGDNIDDEWFTVFLLIQLTKEIDGLVARVVDSDGEFLLIEAANFLPNWANPEVCEKRVYLYNGKIHLIPVNQSNPEEISYENAMNTIKQEPLFTEASTNIQKAILNRIDNYPDKIKDNFHHCKVYLPIGVASILNYKPELISPAVLSFCNRDPLDMKACRAMKYFPPENRVYTSVKFTKCLYAMLHHSKYIPDRNIGWNLPESNSNLFKSNLLGVKIACGFEILAAQSKPGDLESEKAWKSYLESLYEKKYFKDYLEGSQDYNNLLNKAKDFYKSQKIFSLNSSDLGKEILELNRKLDHNADDFKNKESSLPVDDDENWLEINAQDLDKMLEERYGQNFVKMNSTDASNFTGKINEFLDNISSLDGAEFPEKQPIRPPRVKKQTKKFDPKTESSENKINFDPNTFSCAVQNILDLVIPDDSWDLESGSEMSEYGDESESELDSGKMNKKIKEYMEEMDRELAGTTIGKSFEQKAPESDTFDDIESFKPVDIDMTALKNILESYQSQMGAAGPASNMLGPMGIHLEPSTSREDNNC